TVAEADVISFLITLAVVFLIVSLLLAPVEALGWWAGWFGEGLDEPDDSHTADYRIVGAQKQQRLYIVYLDGIAKVDHENYADVQGFLDGLSDGLPEAQVLGD